MTSPLHIHWSGPAALPAVLRVTVERAMVGAWSWVAPPGAAVTLPLLYLERPRLGLARLGRGTLGSYDPDTGLVVINLAMLREQDRALTHLAALWWAARVAAHEAVHAAQVARGDRQHALIAAPRDYATDPSEVEAVALSTAIAQALVFEHPRHPPADARLAQHLDRQRWASEAVSTVALRRHALHAALTRMAGRPLPHAAGGVLRQARERGPRSPVAPAPPRG